MRLQARREPRHRADEGARPGRARRVPVPHGAARLRGGASRAGGGGTAEQPGGPLRRPRHPGQDHGDPALAAVGARPRRPARPAAVGQLHLPGRRLRGDRLRHRHRRPVHPHRLRRPGPLRLHRDQRRPRDRRLQRPRHPRRRHDRRGHLRRREGGEPCGGARPGLHRLGQHVRGHRRAGLGRGRPRGRHPGRGQPEPRRRDQQQPGRRGGGARQRRRVGVGRRGQRQRRRLHPVARPGTGGADRRRERPVRRPGVLLQLRHLRGPGRPRLGIVSDWYTGPTATNTLSGTSMATPHVAGAAAVLLSQQRGLTPAQVASRLVGSATTNVVTNPGTGTPNRLLYVDAPTSTPLAVTNPGTQTTTTGTAGVADPEGHRRLPALHLERLGPAGRPDDQRVHRRRLGRPRRRPPPAPSPSPPRTRPG